MNGIFFKDWQSIGHVAITTIAAFIALFLFVRISGKRTLAKLNAFDFVVSIALGSTLSDIMLGTIPFLEGLIVLFLIIFLQYFFALLARTSSRMERIINTVPRPVFADNEFFEKTMAREAITKEEIYAAIRSAGIDQIKDVKAVVMELNGTMSVIKRTQGSGPSSLDDLNIKN
ncbi:DUF421 domain-containing protein [Flavobacterium endoglycinae]|uniref:DUF421 domain-containing protein n=1 Tax=Flavobacterium endoglycinae TaxID=2816357 RepID=A0ABX7QBR4_9FLAO|nr:YetF domain-containing protein [Flavobacterium endoglycinae]QSW88392.1 DUF421 domain-containing protein [Flavobacterium endoglycinae]